MTQEGVCAWWGSADTALEDDREKHFSFLLRGLHNVFNHAGSMRVHIISLLRAGSPLVTLGLTIDEYAHKGSFAMILKKRDKITMASVGLHSFWIGRRLIEKLWIRLFEKDGL
ncbi:hypothetical protein CEXT_703851 [Caerostris extrusa]|uniref:Uncharacterized protein n=1 Tax=Caerostris extrusa TaxID=172846 RepID=A0AAV4P7K0_CAEEX|nr:hypothetical protein CEXT_703851 [Caerostris extrusa]